MSSADQVTMSASARQPGLDVLRALAITAVLTMHIGDHEASGRGLELPVLPRTIGYYGVELFFILSGFLIGRILIGIAAANPAPRDWGIFLVRRWTRTLPLYLLWVVVLLLTMPPSDLIATAARYITFTQSFTGPMATEWFSASWSLAVEEWFYLLFTVVLMALVALRVRGAVLWACAAFILLPLAARVFILPADTPFDAGMRQVTVYRLDAIAIGVAMAWIMLRAPLLTARWSRPLFLTGCALLLLPSDILAVIGNDAAFTAAQPYLLTLTSLGFAMWLPAALALGPQQSWFGTAVRWLSDRSYCLYIVHLTVITWAWDAVASLHLPVPLSSPLALLASAGLAELSFRYFETPILRRRPRQPAPLPAAARSAAVTVPA
jgi:peptidoglycan/LPS O-acetylase OafA/YrhL